MTNMREFSEYLPKKHYEDEQEKATEFAHQSVEYSELAFNVSGRIISHALGQKWFWDLPPAERKHTYAQFPPCDLMGNPPPPHPDIPDPMSISFDPVAGVETVGAFLPKPPWNWGLMATEEPKLYDRHVEDFATLARDELKKLEAMFMAPAGGAPLAPSANPPAASTLGY